MCFIWIFRDYLHEIKFMVKLIVMVQFTILSYFFAKPHKTELKRDARIKVRALNAHNTNSKI